MRHHTRRGMSLLEVVIAIAMLAAMSTIILGSITFMQRGARRDDRRLEAAEVAHRLITQTLVNKDELPDSSLPIQHGANLYYFRSIENVIVIEDEEGGPANVSTIRGEQADISQQIRNQLHQIVIHVFPADERGNYLSAEPLVSVSRVYNIMKGDDSVVIQRILEYVGQEQEKGRSTGRQR